LPLEEDVFDPYITNGTKDHTMISGAFPLDADGVSMECTYCSGKVKGSDQFCPSCGTIFDESVTCGNHPDTEAAGVCIICSAAFCGSCVKRKSGAFLCADHRHYDITDGMAEVFPAVDDTMAQYVHSCLLAAGLHPFQRRSRGNDFDGYVVNSIRVMVPSQEVLLAEDVMEELDIRR
jgi:hypothetical protein